MTAKRRHAAAGDATAAAAAIFPKKTRDLPDLSLCHGCRHRFSSPSNGKFGDLRTLDSEWRVVLLCRRCFISIRSGASCSYCFSELPPPASDSGDGGVFCCRQCSCRVHMACVRIQSGSISHLALDPATSFVCIDCCAFPRCRSRNPSDPGRANSGEEKVLRKAEESPAEKAREAFDGLAVRCSSSDPGKNGSIQCSSQKDEGDSCSGEQLARNSETVVSSECSAVEGDCLGIRETKGSCAPDDRYLKKYCRRRRDSKGAGDAKESPPCLVGCSKSSSSFRDTCYQPLKEPMADARIGVCSLEKITAEVEKESCSSEVEEADRIDKSNCGGAGGDCIQIRASADGYLKKYSRRPVNSKGLDVIKEGPPVPHLPPG